MSLVDHPNKGRKLTKEHKQKISKAAKENNFGKWMVGKSLSREHKKNIANGNKGRIVLKKTRLKISNAHLGKELSRETKLKLRKIRIEQISEAKFNGNQVIPSWNPKACKYFEQFDKQHNTNGQYATNGGEFYIKKLGYWPDYINHNLKLIMEYDESYHYDIDGKLREKDIIRQQEIEKLYPDYEFRRIKEDGDDY